VPRDEFARRQDLYIKSTVGKRTPVHRFWHHCDLALTRFSGDAAPQWRARPV